MNNFERMRRRLLQRAGIIERDKAPFEGWTYERIRKQECDDGFCDKMDNRIVMGFLRYGSAEPKPLALFYDLQKARQRLDLYEKDGNTEHLVDAANFCRLEFRRGCHPNRHFEALDRK